MKGARTLFEFLLQASERGERTALVTITDVIGNASRAPGTHMAVSETGAFRGSLSGGCVEAAVVGEAKRVIVGGQPDLIRLGTGSPYVDIRLPCGGGMDLLIIPEPSQATIAQAHRHLEERRPVALILTRDGVVSVEANVEQMCTGWHADSFIARHEPEMRIVIVGHGAETSALAAMAAAYGAEVAVLSPDQEIVEAVGHFGAKATHLKTPARTPDLRTDRHSAVAMLFHDHDWEEELLSQALEQEAFFVGAMGSRATHAARLERLRQLGVPSAALSRLVGPIGILPAARDPETLALSTLGQIVGHYRDVTGDLPPKSEA